MWLQSKLSRRKLLGIGAASSATLALSSAYLTDTTTDIEVTAQHVFLPNLPSQFHGYRIGFLADLHIGRNISDEWIRSIFEQVVSTKIDLLLLGGDFIAINDSMLSRSLAKHRNKRLQDVPYDEQPEIVYQILTRMIKDYSVPDGVFGVYGNHDLWVAPELCRASFSAAGGTLLVNQSFEIYRKPAKLKLVGLDDYWNGYPKWPKDTPELQQEGEVRILLCHNPDQQSIILERTNYRFDLGLSGHTHGGQIAVPGVGPLFYNIQDTRFRCGFYKHPKGSISYTTRGLGVVEIPYRFNCRPEACIFELRPL